MKQRLLFINGHLNTGGVEKSLADLLRHLDYSKYEADLLLLEELGDYTDEIPDSVHVRLCALQNTYGPLVKCLLNNLIKRDWFSLKVRLILLFRKFFGPACMRLSSKILTGNKEYDCVVGFRTGICSEIAAYGARAKRRVVWWHHGDINVNIEEYRGVVAACDCVAVVSNACRDLLADAMPEHKEKLIVVPNMLDVDLIEEKACAYAPKQNNADIHIVTVGRLSPEKHVENAIYAAAYLKKKGHEFSWWIVGDGALRSELEMLAKREGVAEQVQFRGNCVNPYPYMKHADMMVHPSYVESQGLSILEAMALGTPCVVTKSRGPCEFIVDGENGLLTEQNAQSLAEQVERMLSDRELYEKIKKNTACPEQYRVKTVMEAADCVLR